MTRTRVAKGKHSSRTDYELRVTNYGLGFTMIEALITTFVIGTVVTGMFGLFVLAVRTSNESERRVVAVALANERVEMVRNLPYVNVGTAGGVPSGAIPQEETVTRNGVSYTVRTDIRYVDDHYDGQVAGGSQGEEKITICHKPGSPNEQQTLTVGAPSLDAHLAHGDVTGACGEGGEGSGAGDEYNADYKQVRVEATWASQYDVRPVLLITYVVPSGIEGGELGGTLDFLALDAQGEGVQGADVHIVNSAVDPAIDTTTQTNAEGRVVLPGLPPSSETYEITVSKEGYTTEQTYDQTADFYPDTDHAHLTMVIGEVTSKSFFIDQASSLDFHTRDETGGSIGNVAYTFQGTKTIGTDGDENLVYVVDDSSTTDVSGDASYTSLVWDSYTITIDGEATGYDIKETSEPMPFQLDPAEEADVTVTLVDHTPLSLHVTVTDPGGGPIDNATVHLTKGAVFDETLGTGVVGQVFFADLPKKGNYSLEVDAPGYEQSAQTVPIDESERIRVELTPV